MRTDLTDTREPDAPRVPATEYYSRSFAQSIVGLFFVAFLFCIARTTEAMIGLAGGAIAVLGCAVYYQIKLSSAQPGDTVVPHGIEGWPLQNQISYYRRAVWIIPLLFPVITLLIISEFNELESRTVDHVTVHALVGLMYDCFGYWGAVTVLPALGLYCFAVSIVRLNRLTRRRSRAESEYVE